MIEFLIFTGVKSAINSMAAAGSVLSEKAPPLDESKASHRLSRVYYSSV